MVPTMVVGTWENDIAFTSVTVADTKVIVDSNNITPDSGLSSM